MNKDYLHTPEFTKNGLLQNVLGAHQLDGLRADSDIAAVVREHQRRQFCKSLVYGSSAGLLLSVYNLTRLGVLSSSGKQAALFGTVFFSFLTYAALDRTYFLNNRLAQQKQQKQEAKQE